MPDTCTVVHQNAATSPSGDEASRIISLPGVLGTNAPYVNSSSHIGFGSGGGQDIHNRLLIADRHNDLREQMVKLFSQAGYRVSSTSSAVTAIVKMVTEDPQVVMLGVDFDDMAVDALIPVLKKLKGDLPVILLSDQHTLSFLRKVRQAGIFYHALTPVSEEDWEEIRQAVTCAFETARYRKRGRGSMISQHVTI